MAGIVQVWYYNHHHHHHHNVTVPLNDFIVFSEILGALLSIFTIWLVTGVLVYLAVERLIIDDFEIEGTLMLITSGCAVIANIMYVDSRSSAPNRRKKKKSFSFMLNERAVTLLFPISHVEWHSPCTSQGMVTVMVDLVLPVMATAMERRKIIAILVLTTTV